MTEQIYDIAKDPADNKWYVIGYVGKNQQGRQQWMAVSNSFDTKQEALQWMRKQYQTDISAKLELSI